MSECSEYEIKEHLNGEAQVLDFEEYAESIHYSYSQVHSESDW